MVTVASTELKNKLGQVIDQARREPVLVQNHGRDVVVILDYTEFLRLRQIAAAYQAGEHERRAALAAIQGGKYARSQPIGTLLASEAHASRKQEEKTLEERRQTP